MELFDEENGVCIYIKLYFSIKHNAWLSIHAHPGPWKPPLWTLFRFLLLSHPTRQPPNLISVWLLPLLVFVIWLCICMTLNSTLLTSTSFWTWRHHSYFLQPLRWRNNSHFSLLPAPSLRLGLLQYLCPVFIYQKALGHVGSSWLPHWGRGK